MKVPMFLSCISGDVEYPQGLTIQAFQSVTQRQIFTLNTLYTTLNCAISPSEIGCALSYIGIYKKIVDLDIPEALILEDDSLISNESIEVISWM